MNKEQRERLREAAGKATPGDWIACNMVHAERGDQLTPEELGEYVANSVKLGDPDRFLFITTRGEVAPDICHVGNGPTGPDNAVWLELSQPKNILALLDALDAAEKERDAARRVAGLGCTANNDGAHLPHRTGNYTFCERCGETLTAATLSERLTQTRARATAAEARVALLEGLLTEVGEELGLWLMLVTEGGVPRYAVCPGAALNSVVTSSRALAAKLEGRVDD